MTLLVILIFGATSFAAFQFTGWNGYFGNVSLFVAIFIAGLSTASIAAVSTRSRAPIIAAVVLIANFAGAHWAWTKGDPVITGAILDLLTASCFVLLGRARWEFLIGALYLLSVLAAALTGWLDVIPDHTERAGGLIAWSYPDIAAILGLACSVLVGAGNGDWGKLLRITDRLRVPMPWAREGALLLRIRVPR